MHTQYSYKYKYITSPSNVPGALGRGGPVGQHQQVPGVRARGAEAARLRAPRHSAGRRRRRRAGAPLD